MYIPYKDLFLKVFCAIRFPIIYTEYKLNIVLEYFIIGVKELSQKYWWLVEKKKKDLFFFIFFPSSSSEHSPTDCLVLMQPK